MTRLQPGRLYIVSSTAENSASSRSQRAWHDYRPGGERLLRQGMNLLRKSPRQSIFDAVEGGCLSLKRV